MDLDCNYIYPHVKYGAGPEVGIKALNVKIFAKYSDFWVVMVDSWNEAVADAAKMLSNESNSLATINVDLTFWENGECMKIVASLYIVRIS